MSFQAMSEGHRFELCGQYNRGICWQFGEHLLIHFDHPKRVFSKTFSSVCGSGLPHANKHKTSLLVPAGSLDHIPLIEPQANLFIGESREWLSTGLSAAKFTAYPHDPTANNDKTGAEE